MINKQLAAYCDECATIQPLLAQTLKEAASELTNKQWSTTDKKHWYCPRCTLQMSQNKAQE